MEIHGEVASGFEKVRDAFRRNFEQHGDVGAAFCLYVDGEKVVDVWAGTADTTTGREWSEDTLQLVFSTTKGATAISLLRLVEEGEIDLSVPVADVWPEFATAGKEDIPVEWLLTHRSGLPVVDVAPSPEEAIAWDPVCKLLAAQEPVWQPGAEHGYHALTYGWLVGEVVKRVSGRSLGTFFADEVASPLGLEFWIGLPEAEETRVSRLELLNVGSRELAEIDVAQVPEEMRPIVEAFANPDSITNRALSVTKPPLDWNARDVHAAEIPAANGICTARSLAKMYAATVGEVDGVQLLRPETLDDAITTRSDGPDKVLFMPTRFGLGFMLNSLFSPLLSERSFGHPGAGGSLGFGDAEAKVGFGYVMNKMQQNLAADPRTLGLIGAVRDAL